jgi:hypothetical protein
MLARSSILPGVKLTWTYASQTGGLLHAQAGQVSQKNCLCGLASQLKHLEQKIEESDSARECPTFYPSFPTLERYDIFCCPVFQVVIF